jgi:hypothetical protein
VALAAMPIDLEHGAFEPEAIAAMGEAFEAACKELHEAGGRELVRELIAKRIIAVARRGELNPVCLRIAPLCGLSVREMPPAASHSADYNSQATSPADGAAPCP